MLALYLVTAIIGGGLVVFSALGALGHSVDAGGHDYSADHDIGGGDTDFSVHDADLGGVDADQDTDAIVQHGEAEHNASDASEFWIPFTSLRFWTYLIAAFGVTGLLLTLFGGTLEPFTSYLALGTGLATGLVASYTVRWLSTHESGGAIGENDFLGADAKVLVPTKPGQIGKVRLCLKGDIIDMVAVSDSDTDIAAGEEVLVVGIDNNRVRIARKEEYLG